MNIKEVLAPSSSERILLVVLIWTLLNVGIAQFLSQPLLRWELILSGILVLGWALWATTHRIKQAEKEQYKQHR